jgi:hypothetical protein
MANYLQKFADKATQMSSGERTTYEDRDPIRWFDMKIDAKKLGDYLFSVYLVPYNNEAEELVLFREYAKHFQMPIGYDSDGKLLKINRPCVAKIDTDKREFAVECPFCAVLQNEIQATTKKEKVKNLYRYQSSAQYHANCLPVVVNNRKADPSEIPYLPHVITLKATVYDWIVEYLCVKNNIQENPDLDPFNIFNAAALQITKERTGTEPQNVKYRPDFTMMRSQIASSEAQLEEIYSNIYDLESIFKMPSDEDIQTYREEASQFAAFLANQRAETSSTRVSPFAAPAAQPASKMSVPSMYKAAPAPVAEVVQEAPVVAAPVAAPAVPSIPKAAPKGMPVMPRAAAKKDPF